MEVCVHRSEKCHSHTVLSGRFCRIWISISEQAKAQGQKSGGVCQSLGLGGRLNKEGGMQHVGDTQTAEIYD